MKKVFTKIAIAFVWFGCGYFSSAMMTADFYGEFSAYNVETKGSASRESLLLFFTGPLALPAAIALGKYTPMWDWPRYLLSDYKVAK